MPATTLAPALSSSGTAPSVTDTTGSRYPTVAALVAPSRVGRGVRPTAAGLLLTGYADAIGRQVAEAETALADLVAGRTGRLTVRYFATAGAALVAPAVARLRAEHPGVQRELKLTDPEDPLPEVKEGRADVALVVGASGASKAHEGVRLVKLLDDPYLAVLPKGHRLAARRSVEPRELAEEPWAGSEWPGPCLDAQLDACEAAGFRPRFAVKSEDYVGAQGFVAAGLGGALIPGWVSPAATPTWSYGPYRIRSPYEPSTRPSGRPRRRSRSYGRSCGRCGTRRTRAERGRLKSAAGSRQPPSGRGRTGRTRSGAVRANRAAAAGPTSVPAGAAGRGERGLSGVG